MAKRVINPDLPTYKSVTEFLSREITPNGTFSIKAGGLPIDLEYEDNGSDVTVVFFHAALSSKAVLLPIFAGRGLSKGLQVNRLSISDPTLALDDTLRLAWFAGSLKQPSLQSNLSRIILDITRHSRKVIYYGASGGGFAALQYSARHPGSVAITINPQTNIAKYNAAAVTRWTDLAWNMSNRDNKTLDIPKIYSDLTKQYRKPTNNSIIYIQNTGDISHMKKHAQPFFKYLHPKNSAHKLFFHSGDGHVPPSKEFLKDSLTAVVSNDAIMEIDFKPMIEKELLLQKGGKQ